MLRRASLYSNKETQITCCHHIYVYFFIGTQQPDTLGNCQCRLNFLDNMHIEARDQVPIFDTTQIGYLSIVGTRTLLPFSGAL